MARRSPSSAACCARASRGSLGCRYGRRITARLAPNDDAADGFHEPLLHIRAAVQAVPDELLRIPTVGRKDVLTFDDVEPPALCLFADQRAVAHARLAKMRPL